MLDARRTAAAEVKVKVKVKMKMERSWTEGRVWRRDGPIAAVPGLEWERSDTRAETRAGRPLAHHPPAAAHVPGLRVPGSGKDEERKNEW